MGIRRWLYPLVVFAGAITILGARAAPDELVMPTPLSGAPPPEVEVVPPPPDPLAGPPPCTGATADIDDTLLRLARRIERERIPYASGPLSDCSGVFHRLLDQVADRCEGVVGPSVEDARSAKAIARWYARQDLLVFTPTPDDADPWLAPGAVAFFTSRPGSGDPIPHITHVGVVVDVERDLDGRVLSYRMFHAHRPGTVATITDNQRRDADPPLGNGPDSLVALSFLAPDRAWVEAEGWFVADAE